MRTGAIVFTRRAKLEAFSAALGWFVKRNGYKPIRLTHTSSYGDFDLMSDGKKIQLSWWLGGMPRPDDEGHTLDDDDLCPDTYAPAYCEQCNRQLADNATDAHAYESGLGATSTVTSAATEPSASHNSIGNGMGEGIDDDIGDTVTNLVGNAVKSVVDDVSEQVFGGERDRGQDRDRGGKSTSEKLTAHPRLKTHTASRKRDSQSSHHHRHHRFE
jgi:hypothetical protein